MDDLFYYLLLFVIYIVFQVLGGKKKKKKPNQIPTEEPYTVAVEPSPFPERQEEQARRQESLDEIGRELREILGIEMPPPRPRPEPVPAEDTRDVWHERPPTYLPAPRPEYIAPKPISHEGHDHLALPKKPATHSRRTASLTDRLRHTDTAREAILLNEILGPPKSKRR